MSLEPQDRRSSIGVCDDDELDSDVTLGEVFTFGELDLFTGPLGEKRFCLTPGDFRGLAFEDGGERAFPVSEAALSARAGCQAVKSCRCTPADIDATFDFTTQCNEASRKRSAGLRVHMRERRPLRQRGERTSRPRPNTSTASARSVPIRGGS